MSVEVTTQLVEAAELAGEAYINGCCILASGMVIAASILALAWERR